MLEANKHEADDFDEPLSVSLVSVLCFVFVHPFWLTLSLIRHFFHLFTIKRCHRKCTGNNNKEVDDNDDDDDYGNSNNSTTEVIIIYFRDSCT